MPEGSGSRGGFLRLELVLDMPVTTRSGHNLCPGNTPRASFDLEDLEHSGIAQGVGFYRLEIEEFSHT